MQNLIGGVALREHLSQPHFTDIRSGRKKYEGRLNKGKFHNNDIITWFNNDNGNNHEFTTKVVSLSIYKTFAEAIEKVGLEHVLPTEYDYHSSIDKAIENVYRKWYSKENEMKYGVILMKLELI